VADDATAPVLVLHEDEHLLAVHKPPGMLVHRSAIAADRAPTLIDVLRERFSDFLHTPHRLDRPTSGLLLIARSRQAAETLSAAFREHRVQKLYLAVVRGWTADSFVINRPLMPVRYYKKDGPRDPAKAVPARTRFRCLRRAEIAAAIGDFPTARYSLVACAPTTGRTHQIRRHLKHAGRPILGDTTHGDLRHNRYWRDTLGWQRLALHACRLSLCHPITGEPLRLRAPLDPDFQELLRTLGTN
jgi:tRNA pseudouridine65 synthase